MEKTEIFRGPLCEFAFLLYFTQNKKRKARYVGIKAFI